MPHADVVSLDKLRLIGIKDRWGQRSQTKRMSPAPLPLNLLSAPLAAMITEND